MSDEQEIEAIARHHFEQSVATRQKENPAFEPDFEELALGWCAYLETARLQHKLGFTVRDGKLRGGLLTSSGYTRQIAAYSQPAQGRQRGVRSR